MEWETSHDVNERYHEAGLDVRNYHLNAGGTGVCINTNDTLSTLNSPNCNLNTDMDTKARDSILTGECQRSIRNCINPASLMAPCSAADLPDIIPRTADTFPGKSEVIFHVHSTDLIQCGHAPSRFSDESLRSFNWGMVGEHAGLSPTTDLCSSRVLDSAKDLPSMTLAHSSQTLDTCGTSPTRESILHQIDSTNTLLGLSPYRRSIIVRSGEKLVKVANLACVDNNYNIAFVTDFTGEKYHAINSHSDNLNECVSPEYSQAIFRSDSARDTSKRSPDVTNSILSEVLCSSSTYNKDKTSLNKNEINRSTLADSGNAGNVNSMDSHLILSQTVNRDSPNRTYASPVTTNACISKLLPRNVIKPDLQIRVSQTCAESQTFSESMELDSDEGLRKEQHSHCVNTPLPTRISNVSSRNIYRHSDTVMADDLRYVSESRSNSVPLPIASCSEYNKNTTDLLIKTKSGGGISCNVNSNLSSRVPNDITKALLLPTPAPNGSTISRHLLNVFSSTTTQAKAICFPNNSIDSLSSKQTENTSKQTAEFSVPFNKPINVKSPLRISKPPILSLSCQDNKWQDQTNHNSCTSRSNLSPSTNMRDADGQRAIDITKQINNTLSSLSNGQTGTRSSAVTVNVQYRNNGNRMDISSSKLSNGVKQCQSLAKTGKYSAGSSPSGSGLHLALVGNSEMASNGRHLQSHEGIDRMNASRFSNTSPADHVCTATTVPMAVASTTPLNNLKTAAVGAQQDHLPQKGGLQTEPEVYTNCLTTLTTVDNGNVSMPTPSPDSTVNKGISSTSSPAAASTLSLVVSSSVDTPTTPTSSSSTSSIATSADETGRRLRNRNQRKFLPEKTRHKRQTLQDMTRPLKQWLYKHRENPYPTKCEKTELVKTSHMTLTQVSNWFANARRRLKNTVRGDDVSWAKRIKVYNQYAEGNAELFSIPSSEEEEEDSWDSDVGDIANESQEPRLQTESLICQSVTPSLGPTLTSSFSEPSLMSQTSAPVLMTSPSCTTRCSPALDDPQGAYHKYKHSIMQDASQPTLIPDDDLITSRSRHRHLSSSTGSHDFEYLSTSSVSSPSHETHHDSFDEFSEEFETIAIRRRITDNTAVRCNDDMYWKEIGAALALTSLARSHVNK